MNDPFFRSPGVAGLDRVSFDAGLRAHMQRVFGYMGGGLAISGLLAWVVAHTALAGILYGTPLRWIVMFAPMAFVLFMNFRMQTISIGTLKTMFWSFCATMGLSMGTIFLMFSDASIARAFFITGATFGAMSLWGYTTRRDLTGFGSFMMMGVFGVMIACVVNIFLHSSMLQWMVSLAGVAIFTGLTAWDVQRIKQSYAESYGAEANEKMAVYGALSLYLNFINAFQFILELTGGRRS
jgi:FtsH-binding integral membrane protein